jgi:hypothetical protein
MRMLDPVGIPALQGGEDVKHAEGEQGLQFDEESAFAAAEKINEELGGEFAAVYRCELTVVERVVPIASVDALAAEKA